MADDATNQARLDEAETALHSLLTGQAEATIEYEGHRTVYTPVSIGNLRTYIRQLQRDLGICVGSRSRRVSY